MRSALCAFLTAAVCSGSAIRSGSGSRAAQGAGEGASVGDGNSAVLQVPQIWRLLLKSRFRIFPALRSQTVCEFICWKITNCRW